MFRKRLVCRRLLFVTLLCAAAGSASVSALPIELGTTRCGQGDFNGDGESDLVVVNVGGPRAPTSISSRPGGIPKRFKHLKSRLLCLRLATLAL